MAPGLEHMGVGPPSRQGGSQCSQWPPHGTVQRQGRHVRGLLRHGARHEVCDCECVCLCLFLYLCFVLVFVILCSRVCCEGVCMPCCYGLVLQQVRLTSTLFLSTCLPPTKASKGQGRQPMHSSSLVSAHVLSTYTRQ